jgi:hypothetical protein
MTESTLANTEPQKFLDQLVASVDKALPDASRSGKLTVERDRSLGDRLAGRPGTISSVRFEAAGEALILRLATGPRWNAEVARVSGGIIISRRTLSLGEWLGEFAGRVAAAAANAAGDSAAAATALRDLGIQPVASDIRVDERSLGADLSALPARLGGRIPDTALAAVGRIIAALQDTLPRVQGSGEPEIIVRRVATDYLPDTLRAYLSLPRDWVASHVFPDGATPDGSFVAQLATIEAAVDRMHDSAVEQDASALLTNGRFLAGRFPSSSLDLS